MTASCIAVVGAGPAGLSSAIALAMAGHRVTVFERHPHVAPLGAGILMQPSGLRAWDALGVGEAVRDVGVRVDRLHGQSHRGWVLIDLPYAQAPAYGISRPALNGVLLARAQQLGVEVLLGQSIDGLEAQPQSVQVDTAGDRRCFDVAVIASGGGSSLPSGLGLSALASDYPWGALHGLFEVDGWPHFSTLMQRYRGPRTMYGLLPTARVGGRQVVSMFWSLPVTAYDAWRACDLASWKDELRRLWPETEAVLAQVVSHEQFSFARYRHAWPRRLAQGRVCLVGDAAHAMSPQLGLGTTLAAGDALALARVADPSDWTASLRRYEKLRLAHVRRFQLYSRMLTPCFQSNLPAWWRDLAFAAGRCLPGMSALMHKSLAG